MLRFLVVDIFAPDKSCFFCHCLAQVLREREAAKAAQETASQPRGSPLPTHAFTEPPEGSEASSGVAQETPA